MTSFLPNVTALAAQDASGRPEVDDDVGIPEPDDLKQIGRSVLFYATVFVVPFGLVGNVFSVVVFASASNFRRTSTVQYLIGLATTDSLYLVGELLYTLSATDQFGRYMSPINFVSTTDAGCKLVIWLRYSTKMMSAWITVVITLERLLAVAVPLKVARLSTVCRARALLVGLCAVCTALTAYPLWTVQSASSNRHQLPVCMTVYESSTLTYSKWVTSTLVVGSMLLPSALLIVFSAIIAFYLRRSRQLRSQVAYVGSLSNQREQFTQSVVQIMCSSTGSVRCISRCQLQLRQLLSSRSTDRQLTMMLIAVCVAALCLQLPYTILYIICHFNCRAIRLADPMASAYLTTAIRFSQPISTFNYAINFLLYCVSGSTFRVHVVQLFRGGSGRGPSRRFDRQNGFDSRRSWMASSTTLIGSTRGHVTGRPLPLIQGDMIQLVQRIRSTMGTEEQPRSLLPTGTGNDCHVDAVCCHEADVSRSEIVPSIDRDPLDNPADHD